MSLQATGSPLSTELPVVNQALEPASVRHGSAAVQKAYQTALAFEQVLVEQLSKSLSASSDLGGEESSQEGEPGSEAGASSSGFASMLPQALSSSVMSAGGLGLATQMAEQLQAHESTGASGATQTPGGGAVVSPSSGGSAA